MGTDPVINGYSRSAIKNLIEILQAEAEKCFNESLKLPAGEEHDEVVAMHNLVKTHKVFISNCY